MPRLRDPSRRRFFRRVTAAALAATPLSAIARTAPRPATPKPLYRISLAQWSLHRRLRGQQGEPLDNLQFAAAARAFGFDGIEYVNTFFKDHATESSYLSSMKKRASDAGVRSLLIMVDAEGDLGDPDGAARARAIENHKKWIDAARFLGCHSIRVNARSRGSREEQARLAADGLRRLTEIGAERGISVIVENHGGLSSDAAWLAGVIKRVDHPRCGTLPDFGNFRIGPGREYDRYQGVKELMPFAKAVSAKSYEFDENGNEVRIDYERMMRIVVASGYRDWVGVEYEGSKHSENAGIVLTKRLLERIRDAITRENEQGR